MTFPYLIRFAQVREDFRLAELRGICRAEDIVFPESDVSTYSTCVCNESDVQFDVTLLAPTHLLLFVVSVLGGSLCWRRRGR